MKVLDHPTHSVRYSHAIGDYDRISSAARTCYKSEDKSDVEADRRLISSCFKNGHHSVLEHSSMTVKFVCDRGVSHELVRHRMASFSQESTRYCNYSKNKFGNEITVVKPVMIDEGSMEYYIWLEECKKAEKTYFQLLSLGVTPETARSVLPTCLKTEVVMTANLREWYHVFDIRDCKEAQPDMHYMMHDLLIEVGPLYPEIFEDLMHERNHEFVKRFVKKG